MLKSTSGRALAVRRPGHPLLALLGVALLTALASIALPGRAQAAVYSEAELTASSSFGSFTVVSGGPSESRQALSWGSFGFDGVVYRYRNGVESVVAANMKFTVSFSCGWYGGGSQGSHPIDRSGHFASSPETLCPNEGLYEAVLTGFAYDPLNTRNRTPQLTIDILGPQRPDDRLPAWTPW